MKTFDEVFKDLQPTDKHLIWIDGDEVRVDKEARKCGICTNQTRFYSISFNVYYCSIKCLNQEWKNYWDASRKETYDNEMYLSA